MDARIGHLLAAHGHLVRTSELVAAGVSRSTISRAVARRELLCVCNGWVATSQASQSSILAVVHGGRLTGSTLLALSDVWNADDRRVHIALHGHGNGEIRKISTPIASFAPPKFATTGVVRHWRADRVKDPAIPRWRTSTIDALLVVARSTTPTHLLASIESCLYRGTISTAGLPVLRAALPVRLRSVVDAVDADSESGLETIMRMGLQRLGRSVESQVRVPGIGNRGGNGRVDFIVDGWLAIEVDGDEFHDPAADRIRNSILVRRGYRWHRFGYHQIMHDWPAVEATLRELLRYPPGFARPDRGRTL